MLFLTEVSKGQVWCEMRKYLFPYLEPICMVFAVGDEGHALKDRTYLSKVLQSFSSKLGSICITPCDCQYLGMEFV